MQLSIKLPESDTVHVQRVFGLNAIAFNLNLSVEVLRLSNSELRLDIVPVSYNNKGLKLPKDKIAEYHEKLNVLFPTENQVIDTSVGDSLILDNNNPFAVKPHIPRDSFNREIDEDEDEDEENAEQVKPNPVKKESNTVTIIYTVKKGDGLLLIADLFDCRVSDIRKWNGMKKDNIYRGQKLKIKVPKKKAAAYKKINSMSIAQKKKLAKKS